MTKTIDRDDNAVLVYFDGADGSYYHFRFEPKGLLGTYVVTEYGCRSETNLARYMAEAYSSI